MTPEYAARRLANGRQLSLEDRAQLWPTTARGRRRSEPGKVHALQAKGINGNGAGMPLTVAVKDWPTPVASAGKRGVHDRRDVKTGRSLTFTAADWPTPTSRDHRAPNSQDSQDSQDRRNADSARGQQLPNFVEHVLQETWGTPSTMDARGRTYTRDGGAKGEERLALSGQAESLSFRSIPQDPPSASDGPPSSPTSPSSLRLSPEFVEWLMGWPPGWTIPSPGSMRREPTASAPPATAWSHWQQRQRTWLSALSWSYAPTPETEPEMRQMELI